jgi:acyl carrier protein
MEVDAELITPQAEFVNDLKLNSLDIADFVLICEDKFGAEIEEDQIHTILTVQDLCDYIAAHA